MHSLALRRFRTFTLAKVLSVLLFGLLTALSARVSVPLPFTPVPLTLQVMVVVLSGLVLGPKAGFVAQLLYLQAILLGAPVTAAGLGGPAAFVSPTAGYLLAFPLAAAASGWQSQRLAGGQWVRRGLGGLAGLALIYACGMVWLASYVGDLRTAWQLGVAPFLGADALKLVLVTAGLSLRDR